MSSASSFTLLGLLDLTLGLLTLGLLIRSRSLRAYWPLLVIALWQVIPFLTLNWLREYRVFPARQAYIIYFYVYWASFAVSTLCSGLLSFTIFQESLRPLKGLLRLGKIMFLWILTITVAVGASVAAEPNFDTATNLANTVIEVQRISGIVVLGLLLFVIISVKPLGLTYRSRIFGVGLGMGVSVSASIYMARYAALQRNMYNNYSLLLVFADCIAQLIWIWYFAVPEPTRKFLLLPTTSPFHQWNLVSERMGYDPGYVAIGGVSPDSFSEAERTIFERIAAQDSGQVERLQEIVPGITLPVGSSPQMAMATEHFQRVWNLRHSSPPEE